ncbi:archaellum component FlaG (FlaF/FlaG flagellin family) [Rhodococcus sp. LBL1]|nr:archaellum component FlaG (FlaF/FlaG flagellin family) [Rhodococcus sp. LBL1]MDH6682169.1 archaellum component FlaG (FlaF/FlaG flagellin family) [Rhodococcus sp. LBL2]
MLEPNGPLPPEIYWRRRAVALGVIVVVVVLVVWIIASLRGGDSPESAAAAATSELTESSTTSPPPSDSSTESGSGAAASGSGSSATGTSASATSTGAATAQCADQSLAIKATPDQPQYKIGDEPSFTIAITNIGTSKCERDLGSAMQQALVFSLDGNKRLWSNVDCYPNADPAVQVLEPGGQARFTVKWSGKTSEPGCAAPRNQVPPGAYTVIAQLGGLRSAPEPFNFA